MREQLITTQRELAPLLSVKTLRPIPSPHFCSGIFYLPTRDMTFERGGEVTSGRRRFWTCGEAATPIHSGRRLGGVAKQPAEGCLACSSYPSSSPELFFIVPLLRRGSEALR
jgi:hypothetical protein